MEKQHENDKNDYGITFTELIGTGTNIIKKYNVVDQIGEGSFGKVYVALTKDGKYVAIKAENILINSRIKSEYAVYKYMHQGKICKNIPQIYDYFETPKARILVMELLGPSLDDVFTLYGKKFQLSTVFMIAHQLIYTLYNVHKTTFIHRDIKPNNFLFDPSKKDIYIMDFGLSKKYYSNGKHMCITYNRSLIGTARYASVNMHLGIEPSRRDDLESVGYMLVHFAKGTLPWQGLKKKEGISPRDLIRDKKLSTSLDELCQGLPDCFKDYISYCRELGFDQNPDYKFLMNLFTHDSEELDIPIKFEWAD